MELENIFSIIYNFYPKHCNYGSRIYKESEEHKNYLNGITKDLFYKDIKKALKKVFKNYYLMSWSYKKKISMHFSILLHENQDILDDDIELINSLGGRRLDLEVYISKLAKVCYLYVIETTYADNKWSFKKYDVSDFLNKEMLDSLEYVFDEYGYLRLQHSLVNAIVPDIETELHYEGNVKVFNCLFSDIEDINAIDKTK